MIIGVTGNYGAGKDSFAEILMEKNFFHISFSDILREELQNQGKKISRDNLIKIGNEMREKCGAEVLAKKALDKIRLQRIIARGRESDPKTMQELQEKESLENSDDANKQQLQTVVKMAKVV